MHLKNVNKRMNSVLKEIIQTSSVSAMNVSNTLT